MREFHPKLLAQYGLPDIPYPGMPVSEQIVSQDDGKLPLAKMLYGLQEKNAEAEADWQQAEPAVARLAELLSPAKYSETMPISRENWWLEVGPVDAGSRLVTIQRGDLLLAAIAAREDGRLRVAVFRPLDAKSIGYLIGLAQVPDPKMGVFMRENNWQYARDLSEQFGNFYAADRGESYLSYWEKGIGISADGSEVETWKAQASLPPRPVPCVVAEITIWHRVSCAQKKAVQVEIAAAEAAARNGWRSKRQQRRTLQAKFIGCLLGGAVGDALGAPVEFMKQTEIVQRFGPGGITQYASAYGGLGKITDDTQMTLFTADGLLRAWVRGRFKGMSSYPHVVAHAYLRWLRTQGERPTCDIGFGDGNPGWLFEQRELHSRRAPGNTCLSALRSMRTLGHPARNNSKGCGGVMRVAPAGLYVWRLGEAESALAAFDLGTQLAALTHGHPTGALTGGVLAAMILALVDGASLHEAIGASKAILRKKEGHQETLQCIELAEHLAASDISHDLAIAQIGQGWIAEEALGISIYCALVARDFRHGVVLAVNHDGDSDSTGAIVGNLLGAMHGVKAIPSDWLEPLELRGVITELAEDLYAFKDWEIGEYSENTELNDRIWNKYPGY